MGLIYRTSSLANVGASSIKNAELTYEEGDGNIAFLLTNLSGSNVSIQGNTTVDGPIQLNGNLQADGIIYASNLTSASQNYTVTYDTGSGRLYYTASSAILGAAPTLQQVTDKGKITTNNIEILGQAIIGNQGINLYAGTNGFSGTPARVYIYDDTFGDSQTISITNTVYSSSGYTLSIARPLLGSSYSLTYPTTGGFFAVSVNSTASNAAGNITLTTVPTASFVTASNVFGPFGSNSIISSSVATTASFVTASNVYGPYGANSVLSSSFAISASWAPFVATNTGSLLVTASVASNTITFTKGDGSTFPITVDTGSGGAGTPAPSDTFIQYNSGSTFGADASFRFIYDSGSLQQGDSVSATGFYSHAEGINTQAIEFASHAEGGDTQAIGYASHAEGAETIASGSASHAEGYITEALGIYSHAEGEATQARGRGSHAEGIEAIADGWFSHAEGEQTIAIGTYSHAEGSSTVASGSYSHAEGRITQATGSYSHAEGYFTRTIGSYSHAEGVANIASGAYSHAEGGNTQAIGDQSHAEGGYTRAVGISSHAEGYFTLAEGTGAHAEGQYTTSSANYSHAEGYYTVASGAYQHVQGQFNISSSVQSAFILGNGTNTSSRSNLIFAAGNTVEITGSLQVTGSAYLRGLSNTTQTNVLTYNSSTGQVFFTASSAVGGGGSGTPAPSDTYIQYNSGSTFGADASFRFIYISQSLQHGLNINAKGQYSHAEGLFAIASGSYSHAQGVYTVAIGQYSHAEGNTTQAIGLYSHAEGQGAQSIGQSSHAEGYATQAIGFGSHAEGWQTIASGSYSHAEGVHTVTSASFQHSQGIANIGSAVTGAFIVGNGTVDENTGNLLTRSNLIFAAGNTVQITGSLRVTGSFYVDSGSQSPVKVENGILILSQVSASLDFANDAAAAAGGVPLGGLYRNGNAISIRIV
jgi:hypothetical protein